MLGRLDGKVALVTGAARGSGALIAKRLVEDGARVVLVDILDDRGKPEAEALGAAARYQHLDITDEQQWQAAVDFTLAEFGGLTTLVNNAAVLHIAPLELGRYGIRVNSVNPAMGNPEMVLESLGLTGTDLGALRGTGGRQKRGAAEKGAALSGGKSILRRGEMADVANAVAFLASDDSSFFNGADFDLDGGLTAGIFLPGEIPGAPRPEPEGSS